MTVLGQRSGIAAPAPPGEEPPRPVVLATLSVRVDPAAERMAIESALETRARLIIANMLWLPPHPATLMLAREHLTLPHEEDLDAVRETAARAAARGIPTGLVVLGPDPRRSPRWWRWAAARRIRQRAGCLVWIAPDG
jgi:hypothetical protein